MRLNPDPEELKRLFRSSCMAGARFSSVDWAGLPGGAYLFLSRRYGLASIHPEFRRKVRRGLEEIQIRPVEASELLAQGRQLNLDTMGRQGRKDPEFGDEKKWRRLVDAVYRTPGVSAVGAFRGDCLAAYAITCRENRGLFILHQMSRTADLKSYPNHTLTFELTRRASEEAALDFVSYGLGSPMRAPGLHAYKSRFGYVFSPQNSVIVIHPRIAPLLGNTVRAVVRMMRRVRPQDRRLGQIETVIGAALLSRPDSHFRLV
jgi:hypothetical protein